MHVSKLGRQRNSCGCFSTDGSASNPWCDASPEREESHVERTSISSFTVFKPRGRGFALITAIIAAIILIIGIILLIKGNESGVTLAGTGGGVLILTLFFGLVAAPAYARVNRAGDAIDTFHVALLYSDLARFNATLQRVLEENRTRRLAHHQRV